MKKRFVKEYGNFIIESWKDSGAKEDIKQEIYTYTQKIIRMYEKCFITENEAMKRLANITDYIN